MTRPDGPVLVCTDGSETSLAAARTGLALLGDVTSVVVAAIADGIDPLDVVGTGMASGLPPDEYDRLQADAVGIAREHGHDAAGALGVSRDVVMVTVGPAGPEICRLAGEVGAVAIVMGTRGRSGIKRALLGSVSDHVVRHAPCPVVLTGPEADAVDPAD